MIFARLQAKTAAHISGAVVACPVSGLRLNCCFLIFFANSMPRIVTAAVSTLLRPITASLQLPRLQRVLVQILLSVCFCRVNDFPEFRLPRPWSTFPKRWLLFRLVV